MKLAVVFWFYKDLAVCRNRLALIRRFNGDSLKIFGLYAGDPSQESVYAEGLASQLDDFYCFSPDKPAHWKWMHGDLILTEWFRARGHALPWDTVLVAQWDALFLDRMDTLLEGLKPGEILLSGMRKVKEIESWWQWVSLSYPEHRARYEKFLQHLQVRYQFADDPWCCLFVVAAIPRAFLAPYSAVSDPELGFCEYRLPTYARVFGVPVASTNRFQPWWAKAPDSRKVPAHKRTLVATGDPIPTWRILRHLSDPRGTRSFHPYFKTLPDSWLRWAEATRRLRGRKPCAPAPVP